ncbi:MAG: hypothetical protein IKC22_07030 [Bacilli bacterium]|nr:hypothetical protein [Bacilli bacterium]
MAIMDKNITQSTQYGLKKQLYELYY